MTKLTISQADHNCSPPKLEIPSAYNAAYDLIQRNLQAGRGDKTAYIDDHGSYTYNDVERLSNQFANLLTQHYGLRREERIILCLVDTIDYPMAFFGAIKAGIVPILINTALTAKDYAYMVADSGASMVFASPALAGMFRDLVDTNSRLQQVVDVASSDTDFQALLSTTSSDFSPALTSPDEACFWLYSSGSTGNPKGTVHVHGSMIQTAENYARAVLQINADDVIFSAAKLFFAYGLGNSLSFPFAVGATTILMAERPTPQAVIQRLKQHQPTVFCGVPTLYAALLADQTLPDKNSLTLRCSTSAGESLPESIGLAWEERFASPIYDGIGSTEMLHIFVANGPQNYRLGTTGVPVPGYQVRLTDEQGNVIEEADVTGDLQVSGPSSAQQYWHNRAKTQATFQGHWVHSGDKFYRTTDGYYVYAGRSDDMLKVSGIYVSPIEVEACLSAHPAVLEAAVVGQQDQHNLTKPAAYIILNEVVDGDDELVKELQNYTKDNLAKHKYPRWIYFVDELPKTATGKIQRFRLRDQTNN
jgi:benzoate-CoA ligase